MYRMTPKAEAGERIAAFQEKLREAGLDAALVAQNADLFYLTGSVQQGMLVVPAEGEPVHFVRRVYERAVEESAARQVVRISGPRDALAWFASRGIAFGKVGFELDVMPVQTYRRFAAVFPEASFEDVSPLLRELRAVKGPSEIGALRSAGEKISALLAGVGEAVRPGMTDLGLSGILAGRAVRDGHSTVARMRAWNQDIGFGCVIAGEEAAWPSYADIPTAGKGASPFVPMGAAGSVIAPGVPFIVDLIWAQDGYLVDMARTYVVGEAPERFRVAHETAVHVLRAIENAIRPGAVAGDLYEIGMDVVACVPIAANFMGAPGYNVKFIGHGIGIEVDEFPFIARDAKTVLAPGMVFTLEPKFVFPGEGAVGLENTYLVTGDGFEKLTRLEEDILSCPAGGITEGGTRWSIS